MCISFQILLIYIYGQSACDEYRPSQLLQGADKQEDAEHWHLLVAGRVPDYALCKKNDAASKLSASEEYEMKVMWYASISSETPPSGQCSCSQCTDLFAGKATVAW